MTTLLAGDIGGTKTILRLLASEFGSETQLLPTQTILYEQVYPSQDFPDLAPIVHRFLATATEQIGQPLHPQKACFGIAGPVTGNTSELTNVSWSLAGDRLERELDIEQVELINDFEAVGYGVLGLAEPDLCTLQTGQVDFTAPIAIIGAGTGLGEGFLIPDGAGRYRVFPSEGSHADFAPRSELEFDLLTYLRELYNIERVSTERVVSGMGIAAIYQFLRDRDPDVETPALTESFKIWKQEMGKENKTIDLSAEVSKAAIAGDDYLCQQAMRLFVEAYGAEAGNLALKLLPYGGLYIAGGIAPKILPLLQQTNFLKAFATKGRVSPLLYKIPVHVVLNPKVGLIGAALCAAQMTQK